jgi:hypothetical protein
MIRNGDMMRLLVKDSGKTLKIKRGLEGEELQENKTLLNKYGMNSMNSSASKVVRVNKQIVLMG